MNWLRIIGTNAVQDREMTPRQKRERRQKIAAVLLALAGAAMFARGLTR